jgi:hypothetical protein
VISTKINEWANRQLFAKNALALQTDLGGSVIINGYPTAPDQTFLYPSPGMMMTYLEASSGAF